MLYQHYSIGGGHLKMFDKLASVEKMKIRNVVEKELERYRISKNMLSDAEEDNTEFHQKIETAINRLPEKEKFLITQRYLHPESEYMQEYQVYELLFDPPISHVTYSVIRNRAMIKLALFLRLDTGVDLKI